jgi:hypothetical protein
VRELARGNRSEEEVATMRNLLDELARGNRSEEEVATMRNLLDF